MEIDQPDGLRLEQVLCRGSLRREARVAGAIAMPARARRESVHDCREDVGPESRWEKCVAPARKLTAPAQNSKSASASAPQARDRAYPARPSQHD